MGKLLCPSMMCANYENLKAEVEQLQQAGADIFHIDVMDGKYVSNFGMGMQDIACICNFASIPVDVHLMIESPEQYIEKFVNLGVDIIYFHPETCRHPARVLQTIHDFGKKAGIVLSPSIGEESVKSLLTLCDYVMVMTVNPGFAGQKYLEFVNGKIEWLVKQKESYGYHLMVDGACSEEKITTLSEKGVDGFVLGTAVLFQKNASYQEILTMLKEELS